jgi:hypothetical protein
MTYEVELNGVFFVHVKMTVMWTGSFQKKLNSII